MTEINDKDKNINQEQNEQDKKTDVQYSKHHEHSHHQHSSSKKDWSHIAEKSKAEELQKSSEFQEEEKSKLAESKKHESGQKKHPHHHEQEKKICVDEKELEKIKYEIRHELIVRHHAEIENLHRRVERDIANAHKYALEKFAQELLPIVDNLERSCDVQIPEENAILKNIHAGIELTIKMLIETLGKHSIKQLNPMGETFNPEQHTAMTVQEDPNVPPNTVLKVIQKGYLINGRLLRPAMVVVSK